MSTASQFFSSSGNRFTDPNRFPLTTGQGDSATDGLNIGRTHFAGEADFFTYWAYRGVAVDSNNTANTYKTLLNASGRGICYGAITPAVAVNTDTAYLRFTVDGGSAVVLSFVPGTVGYRLFAGFAGFTTWFTTANNLSASMADSSFDATKTVLQNAGGSNWEVIDPTLLDMHGIGLAFTSSLLVETKVTSAQNSTTNQERQSGVLYRMGI